MLDLSTRVGLAVAMAVVLAGCGQASSPRPGVTAPGSGATPPGTGGTPPGTGGTPPGTAGASIAYVKDGDIWIVAPDGSRSQPVTSDGAAGAYSEPTFAPDGTIYALRNEVELYHLDTTGRVIGSPAALGVLENGAQALAIAPDGAHLAFVTTGWGTLIDPRFGNPTGSYIYGGTDVITPDGMSVPGSALGSLLYPSWLDPSTLVLSDGVAVYVDSFASDPSPWLEVALTEGCVIPSDCPSGHEPMADFARPVVDDTGTMLAYQYQPYFGPAGRRFSTIDAPPPAAPTVRCTIEGQENHSDPGTFSPDGRQFAFDDTVFDPESLETWLGQGVWVMTIDLGATDCGLSTAKLVAPGGQQPDWGPGGP